MWLLVVLSLVFSVRRIVHETLEIPNAIHVADLFILPQTSSHPKQRILQKVATKQGGIVGSREESIVVCVVVNNDEAYLDEWVDYHHALGVAQFQVYDTSDRFELEHWGKEKGSHVVTVVPFPSGNRDAAYAHCIHRHAVNKNHTWAAFLDVADFLVLKKHRNVIEFLQEFSATGALGIEVLLFGTAGRRVYAPKPVTKRFLYREAEALVNTKTNFVRLTDIIVTTNSRFENTTVSASSRQLNGYGDVVSAKVNSAIDIAVIHHYLRSAKEYHAKLGQVQPKPNDAPLLELTNGTVFDDTAWKALTRLLPKYKLFDLDLASSPAPRFPTARNETAVICAIVINEEAYIDEWIDYHHALGFSHFYLYDNSPDFEIEQWASEKGDHVTVRHYPGQYVQFSAYDDCIKEFAVKHRHTWVAFFDVDEMLYLKEHNNVVDLLAERCHSGSLSFYWIRFGPGDREVYQPFPVTQRFHYTENFTHENVKPVARVRDLDETQNISNPHFVPLKRGFRRNNVNGQKIRYPFRLNREFPTNTAVLHHYNTKSHKEFVAKRIRGRSDCSENYQTKLVQALNRSYPESYPRYYGKEGWEATKKFLPLYGQLYDTLMETTRLSARHP